MATTSETIYTHTCDLCGTKRERRGLRRLGLTDVEEGGLILRKPEISSGVTCDVCSACTERPLSEVLDYLAVKAEEKRLPQARQRDPRLGRSA